MPEVPCCARCWSANAVTARIFVRTSLYDPIFLMLVKFYLYTNRNLAISFPSCWSTQKKFATITASRLTPSIWNTRTKEREAPLLLRHICIDECWLLDSERELWTRQRQSDTHTFPKINITIQSRISIMRLFAIYGFARVTKKKKSNHVCTQCRTDIRFRLAVFTLDPLDEIIRKFTQA